MKVRREKYSQSGSAFCAEFTMENKNGFLDRITTDRGLGPDRLLLLEKFFDVGGSVDVDCAWNMTTVIFIIETTVDDAEPSGLMRIFTIQERVKLK